MFTKRLLLALYAFPGAFKEMKYSSLIVMVVHAKANPVGLEKQQHSLELLSIWMALAGISVGVVDLLSVPSWSTLLILHVVLSCIQFWQRGQGDIERVSVRQMSRTHQSTRRCRHANYQRKNESAISVGFAISKNNVPQESCSAYGRNRRHPLLRPQSCLSSAWKSISVEPFRTVVRKNWTHDEATRKANKRSPSLQ